jgi:uncharacterized protein YdaU (DUF1376 family)
MSKPPAFQFYAADFMIGIMGMTDDEIGVYIKMLCTQWLHGSLPNCKKTIKKMINSRKVPSEMVLRKFVICDDGFLRNERMETVREKQKSFADTRKNNANKRWDKEKNENALAMHVHDRSICKNDALHSSSSTSSSTSIIKDTTHTIKKKESVCVIESPFDDLPKETKSTMDELMAKINGLKPSWQKLARWTRNEMEALRGGVASQMETLTDDDWQLLKDFLNSSQAGYFRPDQRAKLCESFSGIWSTCERWKTETKYKTNKGKKSLFY